MHLRFTGKTPENNIELSAINGPEPDAHEKSQTPISNRLRLKEIFERNRYASGWSVFTTIELSFNSQRRYDILNIMLISIETYFS